MPIRSFSCDYSFNFLLISIAHRTGASGLSKKNERHPIAHGKSDQLPCFFGTADLLCSTDNFTQFLHVLTLLIEKQHRITDQIHKQDTANL